MRHYFPILIALLATLLVGCDPALPPGQWQCDAETVEGKNFVSFGREFRFGATQSTEYAYAGNASSKVSPDHEFGMSANLTGLEAGRTLVATVWRYSPSGKGLLVVQGEGFYQKAEKALRREGDWELLGLEIEIPKSVEGEMSVTVWMPPNDGETAWFDDLYIEQLAAPELPPDANPLRINLDDAAMQQLQTKREKALDMGILVKEKGDWVRGELIDAHNYYHVKMRLKGDWTDHLEGNKWSFRIEVLKNETWNGIEEFSIQRPQTRYNAHEWMWHKMLEQEDVLTTRYQFAHVVLNGNTLGLYAVEEHFGDPLMEAANRPHGLLLRFDETENWEGVRLSGDGTIPGQPYFEAADPDAYGNPYKNRDGELAMWEQAQVSLMNFKFALGQASDYFDAEKWATYLASIDFSGAFHSFHWINLRMYYNPETKLIEPVGYDGFSIDGPEFMNGKPYMGQKIFSDPLGMPYPPYLRYLLNDPEIGSRYVQKLHTFCSENYLQSLRAQYDEELQQITREINREQPLYAFDWNALNARAANIRQALAHDAAVLDQFLDVVPYPTPPHILSWPDTMLPAQANVTVRAWQTDNGIELIGFAPFGAVVNGITDERGAFVKIPAVKLQPYTERSKPARAFIPNVQTDQIFFDLPTKPGEPYKQAVSTDPMPAFPGR